MTDDGWGNSTKSSGWGESSGGGGWGNDKPQDDKPKRENNNSGGGGGGWGESSGGGGWGSDKPQNDRPKRGNNDGGGGWGESSGGGGWGGSSGGSGGGGAGGGGRSCYNCGDAGHMSRDCPQPRKQGGGGGGGRSCYNCGDTGHLSRDCPQPRKQGGGGRGGGGGGGGGGAGWGSDKPQSDRPRAGNTSSGGGWGDSGGGGGWGDDKPQNDRPKRENNSDGGGGGGWGANKSEDNNSSGGGGGGGGWGESGGGDWGSDKPQDQGDDQPRKRFKTEEGEDGQERPAPYKPEELNLDEEAQLQAQEAGENFNKYDEQKVICLPPGSVTPIEKFEDVIKSELLLSNIKAQKYTGMTPIQKWSMPAILAKHDLIGCAQTGSGKTAAFLLPVLQDLLTSELDPIDPNSDCQSPYCLIISPTRELARQISVHAGMLCRDSMIKCHVIYGQIATAHLKSKLSTGCHVLVATPGRLKDFVERGWIDFKNVRYVILDEGDRLVDDGFGGDTKNFFEHPTMPPKTERQTLFFSATFKDDIQMSAKEYLKDNFIFLTVGKIGAANADIKQEFLQVSRQEKKRELKKILSEVPETDKTIIFTQTKMAADMLAGFFTALNLSSTSIHGDRHQSQREQAIRSFKKGEKRFLISSPVGNRGLDLPKVALVINYDLPNNIDEYVHRIGRTGRAGHTGRAISFYDEERDREILPQLLEMLKEAKQEIPDWMEGSGGGFGVSSSAEAWDAAPATDNWDAAPSTNQTAAKPSEWDNQAPSNDNDTDKGIADDKKAQAPSDDWAVPAKQEPIESTNTSDLW